MDNIKQVIVIRKDLKMRRGKEIAQGAHASMAWLSSRFRRAIAGNRAALNLTPVQETWLRDRFIKVCVRVDSEEDLRRVHAKALEAGLESHLIVDSGRTEFGGIPTATACAIGPDEARKLDEITGCLELY
jgi:PTH2 family peptidyl-tRNA hydrolase